MSTEILLLIETVILFILFMMVKMVTNRLDDINDTLKSLRK